MQRFSSNFPSNLYVHATCTDPGLMCGVFCPEMQGLKERRQALKRLKFNIFKKQEQNNTN